MTIIDEMIQAKIQKAVEVLNRNVGMTAAYLFGSQVTGKTDQWSDIDLAIFADGIDRWDLRDRARVAAQVQKETGDDVEIHFFPGEILYNGERDLAGLDAWILFYGIEICS
jgi:predicted nucleotidyltransferase